MTNNNEKLRDSLRVFVVPTEILDEELTIYEKMVYVVLRSYANGQDDTAFPSYETIAKKGSMSRRKAIDCVKKLTEIGLIEKEERLKVSKTRGISNTSNLYTIHRPADLYKNKVVHDMHHPSAHHAPPVVHDMHHPSAHHAHENNYIKELDLKELNKTSSRESIDSELKKKYPNVPFEDIKNTLLNDESAVIDTDKQYKSLLEYRLKNYQPKQLKQQTKRKPTRTELLPDWFSEDGQEPKKEETLDQAQIEKNKREIEEMLKKLRS